MPSCSHEIYKREGWQGYGHWLGTGNLAGGRKLAFLPLKQARLYARTLKLKSKKEWEDWAKTGVRPANVPSCPHEIYKHDGWQGYGHWLGTGNLVGGKLAFLPFKKALAHAQSLNLKSANEWRDWAKTGVRPANMPSRPETCYRHDGWQGHGHWLGTGNLVGGRELTFLPFKKALLHARKLKLKSQTEWKDWTKTSVRPANIPSSPCNTHTDEGWQGYGHWLGTGNVASKGKQFLSFKKALVHARCLKLKGVQEWKDWARTGVRPSTMPSRSDKTYKHAGWQGYVHWLGTGNLVGGKLAFLPFKKALLHARSLKLVNEKEWTIWAKTGARPANMPFHPDSTYKHDGWQGYGQWLGTGHDCEGNSQ